MPVGVLLNKRGALRHRLGWQCHSSGSTRSAAHLLVGTRDPKRSVSPRSPERPVNCSQWGESKEGIGCAVQQLRLVLETGTSKFTMEALTLQCFSNILDPRGSSLNRCLVTAPYLVKICGLALSRAPRAHLEACWLHARACCVHVCVVCVYDAYILIHIFPLHFKH